MRLFEIAVRVAAIQDALRKTEAAHEAEIRTLRIQLAQMRDQCPHPGWEYLPDVEGGHDSMNRCELCGHET